MSPQSRRKEVAPRPTRPKGTTVPELDFARIWFKPEDIDHARGVVAAAADDADDARDLLDKLGLLPEDSDWYYDNEGGRNG